MPSVLKDNPTRKDEVGLVLASRLHPHGGLRGVGGNALLGGLRAHAGSVALVVVVVPLVVVVVVDDSLVTDYD